MLFTLNSVVLPRSTVLFMTPDNQSHQNLCNLLRYHLLQLCPLVWRRRERGRLQRPLLRGAPEQPRQVVEGHADGTQLGVL